MKAIINNLANFLGKYNKETFDKWCKGEIRYCPLPNNERYVYFRAYDIGNNDGLEQAAKICDSVGSHATAILIRKVIDDKYKQFYVEQKIKR